MEQSGPENRIRVGAERELKKYGGAVFVEREHVSCIGDKIVASLSPICCWIQKDTSRP